MSKPIYWQEEDGDEMLWVCECCDAHLHADCVGDFCPVCGESTNPYEPDESDDKHLIS